MVFKKCDVVRIVPHGFAYTGLVAANAAGRLVFATRGQGEAMAGVQPQVSGYC